MVAALHLAASLNRQTHPEKLAILQYLLSKGANINSKDNNRQTPKDFVHADEVEVSIDRVILSLLELSPWVYLMGLRL